MEPVRVLAHLDRPVRLLFWSLDEIAFLMIPFLIGIMSGSFLVIGGGMIVYRFYRKYKKRYSSLSIKAIFYWYFPIKFKWFLPSYKRHFVG